MEIVKNTHIDFMRYRKGFVLFSAVIILLSVFAVFFRGSLNLGIDFTGGTQLTVKFRDEPQLDDVRSLFSDAGVADAQIQSFGEEGLNEILIKTSVAEGSEEGRRDQLVAVLDQAYNSGESAAFDLNQRGADAVSDLLTSLDPDAIGDDEEALEAHYDAVAAAVSEQRQADGLLTGWEELTGLDGVSAASLQALKDNATLGAFSVLGAENVGPQIGAELRRKGILAVVLSLIGMLAYIWFRFELRFGIGALVAVVHDVFITLGFYTLAGFEFNLTTIAAFLTLVGYSVNDSVVVFDRVRENLRRSRSKPLVDVMNLSLNQTLSRTILTSSTTLLAVGSLLFMGGEVLRGFAFIMTIGVIAGTYSSIYIASPFTLFWEQRFGREAKSRQTTASAGRGTASA